MKIILRRKKVKVKNLHHGTDESSKYIRQWEAATGRKATRCCNLLCENEEDNPKLVGAHVIKCGNDVDKNWYIVPLCHKCNSDDNDEEMEVYESNLVLYQEIKNQQE